MDLYCGLILGNLLGFLLSFVKKNMFLSIYYATLLFSVFLLYLFSLIFYRSLKSNKNEFFILFVSTLLVPMFLNKNEKLI